MEYTEEEIKAIEIVKEFLKCSAINEPDGDFFKDGGWETIDIKCSKAIKVMFELVEKQKVALDNTSRELIARTNKLEQIMKK